MYNPEEIVNIELLSSYLRTSSDSLNKFINGYRVIIDWRDESFMRDFKIKGRVDVLFEKFYIPKKNKRLGFRIVYKLKDQYTSNILKTLKFNLNELYSPAECVHGFVIDRNTRTNALHHLNKRYLLKLDIKNFFESIKIESIENAFISLGFTKNISCDLSKICSLDNKLVQGFPTSPILANIVCSEMDKEIKSFCNETDAIYTRYADDISITSNTAYPPIKEIENIINSYGFELNSYKSQKFKCGQNQYVTGLSIADKQYPRIPKSIKRKVRQQLYYIKKFGYHSYVCYINNWADETDETFTNKLISKLRNRLKGWADYINAIEPDLAKKLYELFNLIEEAEYEKRLKAFEDNTNEYGEIEILTLKINAPIPRKNQSF
jgi:RNA-directed DNA polymerase